MSIPQEELPILEAIINVRNRLTALKMNRGEYIKSSDVQSLYHAALKQVTKLNDVREGQEPHHNRLDTALADVFNLLSLFFLTLGKTREVPATYCQITSIRQLLEHMNESSVFSKQDLIPLHARINELRGIVHRGIESGGPEAMTRLLERELGECDTLLQTLEDSLAELSVELVPLYEKLVSMRRQLVTLGAKPEPSKAELKPIVEELRKIESKRVDGKFMAPGGSYVPPSQAMCSSLLEECFDIVQEIRAHEDKKNVTFELQPIYDRLSDIRAQLESLTLTQRWTLRETDLWNYSLSLQEIDNMRVDGKFVDSEGNKPGGQFILMFLLRRCYGLLYRLLSSSEPVSEELIPIANKLTTVKKCLNEVLKVGGPFSPRDLYPYQLVLHQVDSMRKEGKFVGSDGSIPEGQGILMAHLNECHELLEMLKETMEEKDEDSDTHQLADEDEG